MPGTSNFAAGWRTAQGKANLQQDTAEGIYHDGYEHLHYTIAAGTLDTVATAGAN